MKFFLAIFFTVLILLSWPLTGLAQVACEAVVSREQIQGEIKSFAKDLRNRKSWIQSHLFFWQQARVFNEFSKKIDEIELDSGSDIDNSAFHEALKKVILEPRKDLTPEQIRALSDTKEHEYVTKAVMYTLSVGEVNARILQRMTHYWMGRAEDPPLRYKTFQDKVKLFFKWTYNGPIRFMLPFIPLPEYRDKVDRIFEKKYKDSKYTLTSEEKMLLKENKALEAYKSNVDFQKSNPKWSAFRKWISRAFVAGLVVNGALLANWTAHLAQPDAVVDSKSFLEKPEYRLGASQVRIYNESVPLPHMAIEIDGKVYSYGQTHMSVKTSQEYLLSEKIKNIVIERDARPDTDSVSLANVFKKTGLDQLPRSVQMVTLNLNPEQKNHLKRQLELSENYRYRNQTLVMDCATMVIRALHASTDVPVPHSKTLPFTADASPSSVMMYFGMLKSLEYKTKMGVPLVGDIKQVAMDRADEKNLHLWRNLYINAVEGRVFLSFFAINTGIRTYLNVRYGSEDFQYLEPEVKAEIAKWQQDVLKNMTDMEHGEDVVMQQYQVFLEKARELGAVPESQRTDAWDQEWYRFKTVADYFFDREVGASEALLASADSSFSELIRHGYRIEILKKMKTQVLGLAATGQSELKLENAEVTLTRLLKSLAPQSGLQPH